MDITSTSALLLALAFSVVISFVADSLIRSRWFNTKPVFATSIAGTLLIAAVSIQIYRDNIMPYSHRLDFKDITVAFDDWAFPPKSSWNTVFKDRSFPVIGKEVNDQSVVFLGDSNLEQYGPTVERLVKENPSRSVVFATAGSCAPFRQYGRTDGNWCNNLLETAEEFINQNHIKRVVIGAFWTGYYREPQHFILLHDKRIFMNGGANFDVWLERLREQILDYKKAGIEVFLVGSSPVAYPLNPHNIVNRNIFTGLFEKRLSPMKIENMDTQVNIVNEKLELLTKETGITFISPVTELCPDGLCPVWGSNGPIYKDAAHIRPYITRDMKILDPVFK